MLGIYPLRDKTRGHYNRGHINNVILYCMKRLTISYVMIMT